MISAQQFLLGKTAAIFDFDGTLGDTIGLWNQVDVRLAEELGHPGADPQTCHALREDALRRFRNEPNPYQCYCGEFGKSLGSTLTAEQIHAKRYQISRRMLREDVRLRKGAADVLRRLKSLGLRLAVSTTTRRANIEIYCNENQLIRKEIFLADIFEHFVCKEDVQNIKPDPECYQRALVLLDLKPQQAFAVEDTLAGIEAACNAGLACIGIREKHSEPDADAIKARAALYFEDYAEFLSWLG